MADAALTIGRVGLSVSTGTDIRPYPDLAWEGGRLSFSGDLIAATSDQAVILRSNLNGYLNNTDEDSIPVTWSDDDTIDGYYTVLSVELSTNPVSYLNGKGWFPFKIDLLRVDGYQNPLFEAKYVSALRVNAHSITAGTALAGVTPPPTATSKSPTLTTISRPVAEGTAVFSYTNVTAQSSGAPNWYVAPADYYDAAATVTVYDGTDFTLLVGRQTRTGVTGASTLGVENGLVRLHAHPTGGPFTAGIGVSAYNTTSGTWSSEKLFQILYTASDAPTVTAATILRNSPEQVSVRYTLDGGQSGTSTVGPYLDASLARGARHVELNYYAAVNTTLAVFRGTAETASAVTAGIFATTNDGTNYYVMATPLAKTNSLTAGAGGTGFTLNSSNTSMPFMIGMIPKGVTVDTATNMISTYMAATVQLQQTATR